MDTVAPIRAISAAVLLSLSCWISPAGAEDSRSIGYSSVAAALEALRASPTATESTQHGWTVFVEADGLEIWSFTPEGHPAHPSAAKRTAYQDANGAWSVRTNLLCGSTKANCDALMEQYRQLDDDMKKDIQRRHGTGS